MKIQLDKRNIVLYVAVILIFLAIQFVEPYPKGTEDFETYNFAQWIVYPPIAAFVMTIVFFTAARGSAENKLPIILWIILAGTFAFFVSDFSFGIGYSFGFALVLCGWPSGTAFLLSIAGRALFEVLDESSKEALQKWDENNTSGFRFVVNL